MNRRSALLGGIWVLAAADVLAIAGCQTGASTRTQLQTDAALVTAGVAAVAVSVLATPNLAPDTAAKINSAVATVNAANQVIQGATAVPGTAAQQLVMAIKMAAPILLATLPATSAEAIAINAALALLPTILAAAGLPPAPAAAMVAQGKTMDPATAVLVLKGFTGK